MLFDHHVFLQRHLHPGLSHRLASCPLLIHPHIPSLVFPLVLRLKTSAMSASFDPYILLIFQTSSNMMSDVLSSDPSWLLTKRGSVFYSLLPLVRAPSSHHNWQFSSLVPAWLHGLHNLVFSLSSTPTNDIGAPCLPVTALQRFGYLLSNLLQNQSWLFHQHFTHQHHELLFE